MTFPQLLRVVFVFKNLTILEPRLTSAAQILEFMPYTIAPGILGFLDHYFMCLSAEIGLTIEVAGAEFEKII